MLNSSSITLCQTFTSPYHLRSLPSSHLSFHLSFDISFGLFICSPIYPHIRKNTLSHRQSQDSWMFPGCLDDSQSLQDMPRRLTGMSFYSFFIIIFFILVYYSYALYLQNFEMLHPVVQKIHHLL